MNEKVTDNQCIVCSGWLIERSEYVHHGIVGVISTSIKITGYHCENCGLEYHKLPK